VELRFSTGESLSVFAGETVFLRRRGYSNDQYSIMPLSGVSPGGESQMLAFARQQVGKRFNRNGMHRAVLPTGCCRRRTDGHAASGVWFCSELVAATLQQGGYLSGVATNACSPNLLYGIARAGHSGSAAYGPVGRPLQTTVGVNSLALKHRHDHLDLRCFGGAPGAGAGAPRAGAGAMRPMPLAGQPRAGLWGAGVALGVAAGAR
jgi:hypothetical protein